MWHRYQPNPDGLMTDDCTVRAVCAVTGLPWDAAHKTLCSLARQMADMPNTNRVWWAFLRGVGYRQVQLPNVCPECYTVEDFARDHPAGKYVLGPFQHAVAVIDGEWWDTWDSGRSVPFYYFEDGGNEQGLSVLPVPGVESGGSVPG